MTTLTGMGEDSDGAPEDEEDTATRAAHPEPTETRLARSKDSRSAGWRVDFMTGERNRVGDGRQEAGGKAR